MRVIIFAGTKFSMHGLALSYCMRHYFFCSVEITAEKPNVNEDAKKKLDKRYNYYSLIKS